jgi:predicted peptidase
MLSCRFVMLRVLTALSLLAATAFARSPDTGFLNRTIVTPETTYRYQVFVPADWNRHSKWPVILALHGSGERGEDGLLQTDVGLAHAIRKRLQKLDAIVVMPQCRAHKAWTDPDMEEQALATLEQTMKEFRGDPDRVYLTGLSMGGYGSWNLAAKYPEKFAALVIICGGVHGPRDERWLDLPIVKDRSVKDAYAEIASRIGRTPVWVFHGSDDDTVPVEESRRMVEALKKADANYRYTEYPGVKHVSWDRAYAEPELFPWLLQQTLQH